MASEGSSIGRHSLPLLLVLTLAGLAGNYFKVPLFFNVEFLFGSIFSLLALQFFGLGRATLVALIISSYASWQHPYAIVILTAEAAVVGWLVTRRRMGTVLADTLFWICLGMPLVYLFYHLVLHHPGSDVSLDMVKQAVNGIGNALVARLLFTVYALRSRTLPLSFREIIYNLLAVFVLCPALILLAVGSRADFTQTDLSIQDSLLRESRRLSSNLDYWINSRKLSMVSLAKLASDIPETEMQARLDQARSSDRHFLRIGLLNREAVTIAHSPLTDESGSTNLGKSFADRPYIPTLQRTRQPLLSELVAGTIDGATPRVLMLVPVIARDSYAGYLAGVLDLRRVQDVLQESVTSSELRFTLLDKHGKVIISNRGDQTVMAHFEPGKGTRRPLGEGVARWEPDLPEDTPSWDRWKNSFYTVRARVGNFAEWDLILEQPVRPFQKALFDRYAAHLGLLFLIFLGFLLCAEMLSRYFQAGLSKLRQLTSDLPARLTQGQEITWPEHPVMGVRDLVENFRDLTASLSAQFQETRKLNETLEQRVTERTAELSSLNRDFVSFLENTSDYIFFKDENSRFRFCSQALAAVTGYANWRDIIGKHDTEVFPEPTATCSLEEDKPIFRDGISIQNKVQVFTDAQGRRGWITTNKWPLFDASGKVVGIFGICRDITESIKIQESLQLAQESLNQVPDPIIWADLEGRIVACNTGASRRLGYSHEELLGTLVFDIDPAATPGTWGALIADLKLNKFKHFESTYRTKQGRGIPMDVQLTYISFGDREYICGVARDLTERNAMEEERLKLERQSLHLQKLESLGVLSGGIAHDFNNLLQVVLGNLDLGLMMLPKDAAVRKNLEQAVIATVRASELSGMMLAYSGKGVLTVKKLNLSDLVQENAHVLAAVVAHPSSFIPALHPELPPVQADATQVLQVVMNLIRNAGEAIGEASGTITLTTGVDEFDQATLNASRLEGKLPGGRYVWLEVRDNGCGMDEATQYKSFDPFFTTKFTGRGLGMSAALGIMRAHKGAILLDSSPGTGTSVRLLFPVASGPLQVLSSLPGAEREIPYAAAGRRNLILVVDDEEMVRNLSTSTLQAFGYDTLAASDGDQALEIFRREGNLIDLVMLDQNMPTMDGLTVFKELRRIRPEVKVLLASGFSEKEVTARFKGLDLNGFIQKPYNVRYLLDEIKRVLGRSGE